MNSRLRLRGGLPHLAAAKLEAGATPAMLIAARPGFTVADPRSRRWAAAMQASTGRRTGAQVILGERPNGVGI